MAEAVFAAGCFWGVESTFAEIPGVTATEVGYCNGKTENPTYDEVCSHTSGHAEAVRVSFDDSKVSYQALVRAFFDLHDPTQVNRQGPDIGDQYRSAIFTISDQQDEVANSVKSALDASGHLKKPIATIIEPLQKFWRAEEYHQQYFAKRGGGACHVR